MPRGEREGWREGERASFVANLEQYERFRKNELDRLSLCLSQMGSIGEAEGPAGLHLAVCVACSWLPEIGVF